MKREIKFRAWHNPSKKMLGEVVTMDFGKHISPGRVETVNTDCLSYVVVGDCELMQFTGLKDKNGKDIYEGDILRFKTYFAAKRYWRDTDEIKKIEDDFEKQKTNIKTEYVEVKFDHCSFNIGHNLVLSETMFLFGIRTTGSHTNGEWEDKKWDFEVIGNIYENPELLK